MQYLNRKVLELVVLFHCWIRFALTSTSDRSDANYILEKIRNSSEYNLEEMPQWKKDEAVHVNVSIFIETLSNFHASDMAYDVDCYLKLGWYDERLRHSYARGVPLTSVVNMALVWSPDLYFANARTASFQDVIKPNRYIDIQPNGALYLSARILLKVSCMYNLRTFPLDSQECNIRILSYTNPMTYLVATWRTDKPLDINSDLELPEMNLISKSTGDCKAVYTRHNSYSEAAEAEFSCLLVTMKFSRRPGHYFSLTYAPSGIVVVISWISFWIEPNAIPARITLCFTTFLTLSTTAVATTKSLPPVSYMTALSIWMAACTFFVFATLIEFAVVYNLTVAGRKHKERGQVHLKRTSLVSMNNICQFDDNVDQRYHEVESNVNETDTSKHGVKSNAFRKQALRIDQLSRILFPTSFVVFVLGYFVYYKSVQ